MYTEAYIPLAISLLGGSQRRLVCTLTSGITISEQSGGEVSAFSARCCHADVDVEFDTTATGGLGCGQYLSSVVGVLRGHGCEIPPHRVTIGSSVGCLIGLDQSVAVTTCYVNWLRSRYPEALGSVDKMWVVGQAYRQLGLEWPTGVRTADLEKQSTIYVETPDRVYRLASWPASWSLLFCQPDPGDVCSNPRSTWAGDGLRLDDREVEEALEALNSANLARLREVIRTRFIKWALVNGGRVPDMMRTMVEAVMDRCRHAAFAINGTNLAVITDSNAEANELKRYADIDSQYGVREVT